MPASAASNSGSMRPSPSVIAKSLRLPAGELDAVDRAREVDLARGRPSARRASTGSNTARWRRSTSTRAVDVGGGDFDLRPLDGETARCRRSCTSG